MRKPAAEALPYFSLLIMSKFGCMFLCMIQIVNSKYLFVTGFACCMGCEDRRPCESCEVRTQ
jgi:hypothetical protein